MRILFWMEIFWPEIGGVEIFTMELIRALRAEGHEVLVITSRTGLAQAERADFEGTPVYRFPFQKVLVDRSLGEMLKIAREIRRIVAEWQPDVVHLHSTGSSLFYFERAGIAAAAPMLFTLHSPIPTVTAEDSLLNRTLQSATRITAVSRSILGHAQTLVPSISDRSTVLLNALKQPALAPAPLPLDPPQLLCTGRMVTVKGFDIALRAFRLVLDRQPAVRLRLAGEGPEKTGLGALAQDLGIAHAVRITGFVAPEDVPAMMNEACCVLVPSTYEEPFGLVALQAAQMGRPVIASNAGGLPEIIDHRRTGLLVPPGNPDALATAMLQLLADRAALQTMGRQARELATTAFSWCNMYVLYTDLYSTLCKNRESNDQCLSSV